MPTSRRRPLKPLRQRPPAALPAASAPAAPRERTKMGPLRSQDAIWARSDRRPGCAEARMSRRSVARRVAPTRWGCALAGARVAASTQRCQRCGREHGRLRREAVTTSACRPGLWLPLSDRGSHACPVSGEYPCEHEGRCRLGLHHRPARRQLRGPRPRRLAGRRDRRSETPAFLPRRVRATTCGATDRRPRFRAARGPLAKIG